MRGRGLPRGLYRGGDLVARWDSRATGPLGSERKYFYYN
jgi:hypothetical protein